VEFPTHFTKKSVKEMNREGKSVVAQRANAWKFEEFIFDALPFATTAQALLFPRESCFAPLKNLTGEDSIQTVQEALLALDRVIFEQVSGNRPPLHALFELAPQFYYPTAALLEKWKGKPFPNEGYIHE
jgi:UDP-N-acetylglucosamine/UDP-N-acetylgalactosamine diphosphorylase